MSTQTVKFKVSDLKSELCEKIIVDKLREADGVLDVEMDPTSKEVTVSISHPATCDGVYCSIEKLGYKVHPA